MSHYSSLKTKIKKQECLIKALQKIDNGRWKNAVEVNEIPKNLIGYTGDTRAQKAEIIIRRKYVGSASNDIGFAKQADGTWQAIISDYDSSKHSTKWLDHLNQLYALEVVTETAYKEGFSMSYTEQNGQIFVNCEKD